MVIAYASRSLRISQRRYCTTRREMLAAVVMCTHFRSYFRGSQFTLITDHSSLRWLQKFKNEDGMLARWYLLLGQFSVTFEYRPGSLHSNADGMSRQCGQCRRPDCPVSVALVDQPFATSEMGDSMDSDLLPELSGETWVTSALLDELTWDLPTDGTVMGGIRKCSAVAGLCRTFTGTTLLATTIRKPENRLGGSSVAPSIAPIRGLTVSGSSSRTSRTDSTVS